MDNVRVVIVEDHEAIGDGLAALLRGEGINVIGVAADPVAARGLIELTRPSVVLCDIMLGGRDAGLDLLTRYGRSARFLMFSAFDYPAHYARVVRGGACGFLSKTVATGTLLEAVRTVAGGGRAFPASVIAGASGAPRPPTRRELQVLELLERGASNEQMASTLGIAVKTVEGMLRRLFDRYGLENRTQLALFAQRQGWLTSSMA